MGGAGFGQGFTQGLQQAQDRAMQMSELKLRQDHLKAQQKQMETEDEMKNLQLQSLQRKIEAETRLPSQQANLLGPQGAQLGEGQQGPPVPQPEPDIDRHKLVSFLQSAQQAGQDPNQLLSLMGLADPRIRAISESLQPEKVHNVKPGESLVKEKAGGKAETIFQSPMSANKPPDFGDRLESAAAVYGQNTFGKPMSFTELLAADPIKAAKIRDQAMVDEPATIQAGKGLAMLPVKEQELLTPSEANELGVPFGTTKGEAKGTMAITVQQRAALSAFDVARSIVGDIASYSEKVNTAAGGLKGRAEQSKKLWGAWTQSDPDAALLQSKAGELANLARSLGEKGALADKDIARVAALVPNVMDTRQIAAQKIADMQAIINQAETSFRKSLGMDAQRPVKPKQSVPVPKQSSDPLASIPVPKGLTPQQEQVYRQAYATQKQATQQKMKPSFAQGIGSPKP